jgi:6-methylsalicylate decarboxylase
MNITHTTGPLSSHCQCCSAPQASPNRRQFLCSTVVAGAVALSGTFTQLMAQSAETKIIDVHRHIYPPNWVAALKSANSPTFIDPNWTPQRSLEDMDKNGVGTAMLSVTYPQVGPFPKADAARIAREANEYTRRVADQHPGRFGVFAMLPLPNVDESLKEIEYSFDVLKVNGVGVLTSYGTRWLGHPDFRPVLQELNRRKAIVYTHPTIDALCCVEVLPGAPVIAQAIDIGVDTTRTLTSLIFSGASQQFPDINFIFSHAGGSLMGVVERMEVQIPLMLGGKVSRETVDNELKRFYYDTAQVSNSVTLGALVKMVPITQILFGTDHPYRNAADHVRGVEALFKDNDRFLVERGNAMRLMPQL